MSKHAMHRWTRAAILALMVLAADAPAHARPPCRLETVRAGKLDAGASIVMQFSGPAAVEAVTEKDGRLGFVLKNVVSDLAGFRRYTHFNGFLALEPSGVDLTVTIGLDPDFKSYRLSWLDGPRRLVVYLCRQAPPPANRLIDIWGGLRAGAPVICLTFSEPIDWLSVVQGPDNGSFTIKNSVSDVAPRRKYHSFDGELELIPGATDLVVRTGPPPGWPHMRLAPTRSSRCLEIIFEARSGGFPATDAAPMPLSWEPAGPAPSAPPPSLTAADPNLRRNASPAAVARPPIDPKQIGLIQARILARQGLVEQALAAYRDLRDRYPDDGHVWADYAETLIDSGRWEQARAELDGLLARFAGDLRGRRLQARLLVESGRHAEAMALFEKMGAEHPWDVGLWSDYAFACQDAGHWDQALDHFSRVLELDPQNQTALQNVHTILRAHRPRVDTAYRTYELKDSQTRTQTHSLTVTRHLSAQTVVDARYQAMEFTRPDQAGVTGLDKHLASMGLGLAHTIDRRWTGRAAVGAHEGPASANWAEAGVSRKTDVLGEFSADAFWHRPWIDPVEAVERQGLFNRLRMGWDFSPATHWNFSCEAMQEDYRAQRPGGEGPTSYGRKRALTALLSRTLLDDPHLSVGYGFYRSVFDYDDPAYTPIEMLPSESVHTLSAGFEYQPCAHWTLMVGGGLRRDTSRSLDSWFVLPGVRLKMGNRVESDVTYDYSTESGQAAGGRTEALTGRVRVIF
jgi:Flp pilus assembly protein TadD